eukprot:CAMPEP_0172383472 /NCGR_PEP_ID=MMETSP1061-20121228/1334_1 /TAXON_ID=37318 /ORGANISM="Pseudo-nitzschia pungens, Strain cf. pungens" /LENGTH=225 /DNA_ID=CAMNT_0013111723 /DNA_START=245 /DNA_END=922 /DNA_ORIENTATION=-
MTNHHGRLVLALLAVSFVTLLGGSCALIAPPPGAAARMTQTTPGLSNHPAGSVLQRQEPLASFALQLGFNSNNNNGPSNNNNNNGDGNGNGNGGGANLDPGLKLLVCILIDFVGVASFAAPGLGEATDAGWAPISALLINYLFGNGLFTALALVEELSPGLDFIPTATIAWFLENSSANNNNNNININQQESAAPPPPSSPSQRAAPRGRPADDNSDVIDVDVIN